MALEWSHKARETHMPRAEPSNMRESGQESATTDTERIMLLECNHRHREHHGLRVELFGMRDLKY
jgi:hypothetical protein